MAYSLLITAEIFVMPVFLTALGVAILWVAAKNPVKSCRDIYSAYRFLGDMPKDVCWSNRFKEGGQS